MTMPKYYATFAANVRAYTTVTIEAADEAAAHQRFQELAAAMGNDVHMEDFPEETQDIVFSPEYDTLTDIEYLEDPTPVYSGVHQEAVE
jgi:hypothetical protein